MSLAAARLSRRLASRPAMAASSDRCYSSGHHDDHHEEHDNTVYPADPGFLTRFWFKFFTASTAIGLAITYAPAPNEVLYLTKWIGEHSEPEERVAEKNLTHTMQSKDLSDRRLFFQQCKRPLIRTSRNPHTLTTSSPYNAPIGGTVDMSDIKFSDF